MIYGGLIFDEMHIISTDHELRPGLTSLQVNKDILIAFNVWAFLCGVFVLFFGAIILSFALSLKPRINVPTRAFVFRLAFACWLVLCFGPFIAAVQYFLEMRERLT